MKKQFSFTSRCSAIALVAGGLCLAGTAFGEENASSIRPGSATSVTQPPSRPPSDSAPIGTSSKPAAPAADSGSTRGGSATSTMQNTSGELGRADQQFMMAAAKGGMMEVHMGQMAEKQGQSAEVKKIGMMMVTDHTKANNQLMALATKKGVKLDSKMPKMAKMDGANFDQSFLDSMVKDHQKDITAFESEVKNGNDAEVKSFAKKTLPTLKMHLKTVQAAQGKMAKKS